MVESSQLESGPLDREGLARLIERGEPGGVERKARPPQDGLGPSVAAFANGDGGWILLGVDDDGTICGWSPPGRAHAHDHLRERIRAALDPMPVFITQTVETAEGVVVAIYVPASAIRPHIVRKTGVVYERESGGKRPIDSQAKLLAMTRTPQEAEVAALDRLSNPPLVAGALGETLGPPLANGQLGVADWIVWATPLAVPPAFGERAVGRGMVRRSEHRAARALFALSSTSKMSARTRPRPRGFVIDGVDTATREELQLTVDAVGTVVARWSQRLFGDAEHLHGLVDKTLKPLLEVTAGVLSDGGALGAAKVHALARIRSTDLQERPAIRVHAADQSGTLAHDRDQAIFLGAEVRIPLDDDGLEQQVRNWTLELGRHAGIALWQPDPT